VRYAAARALFRVEHAEARAVLAPAASRTRRRALSSPQLPLPTPPAPCSNYTTQQCDGLAFGPSAATAAQCEALCCADPTCQIWQFLPGGAEGGGCWTGLIPPQGCAPGTRWISFANASRSAASAPAWAAPAYADTPGNNWSVVDFPHDFIISGPDSSASPYVDDPALQGQAFIPKAVGAYRKHFAVPADWAGTHVELYVEGMYAYATYYLNGAFLGTHALGYTSFSARLDNSSAPLVFGGGENVLAVFVDATSARDSEFCAAVQAHALKAAARPLTSVSTPTPLRATQNPLPSSGLVVRGRRGLPPHVPHLLPQRRAHCAPRPARGRVAHGGL